METTLPREMTDVDVDLDLEMWIHEEPLCEDDHERLPHAQPLPKCGVLARARMVFDCGQTFRLVCAPLGHWCEVPPAVVCLRCGRDHCIRIEWF
jgi:hypothetical protein